MARMDEASARALPCGCTARTARDFLGRVVGTILTRGESCGDARHVVGRVVPMPGRENAGPGGGL
jgi:hypothetical protein